MYVIIVFAAHLISFTGALVPADVFGKYTLPASPAAMKANESLNTWLVAKKKPDGAADLTKTGYQKYLCGTTTDFVVQTKKPTSLCIPDTNNMEILLEGNIVVGQGANVTTKQIKNGPVSLFFPQSINMNPNSKFSYVVGIWDLDSEDNSVLYLNTAYQFGSGLCDTATGFTKAKLYDWDSTAAVWDKQFGKKETHRFIALAWKAKDEVDGTKFTDRKLDNGLIKMEDVDASLTSLTPVAGIWFTVFNPCAEGDTDCLQCQWAPAGQKEDPAATPPKPFIAFTKCVATDGKAGYCDYTAPLYTCKTVAADCLADGGSDINKVCQCDVPTSKLADGSFPNGYCVSKTTKDCQSGGRSCKKQTCADVKTDGLPCECKAPKTGYGSCKTADCNDATGAKCNA